jgi:hypothetical protein
MAPEKETTMRRWFSNERADFQVLVLAGGLTVVAGLVAIVRDLIRILPNRDVPVTVDLADVPHELLLDGAVDAEATEAVLRVSDLGPLQHFVVLAAEVLPVVVMMLVAVCFTLLGRSFYRGEFFARGCVVAINTAAVALVLVSVLVPSLTGAATRSALASVGIGSGMGLTLGIEAVPFLGGLLLGAVGYAFQRGARLQRDTEGLV